MGGGGGSVVAPSARRVRFLALATTIAVCATMLQARTPVSADVVTYQRVDRTYLDSAGNAVTLRTRGSVDDACLQRLWWPCPSAAGTFSPDATAQAFAIKELARSEHPTGPLYPIPSSLGDDTVQWNVAQTDSGDGWAVDVVTDDAGGQYQAYDVARYGDLDARAKAQARLKDAIDTASGQLGLGLVPGHDLMDRDWSLAYFDRTGHVWCAWAGKGAGADQDPADTGILYFAPQGDGTIPKDVRERTPGCAPGSEDELVALCARVDAAGCVDDGKVTAATLLALGTVWAQRQGQGAPEEAQVPDPARAVLGRPYAQVTDWQHMASYTVYVARDPARSLRMVLDYGDGVYDQAKVPAGNGVWTRSFTHQFTAGFGLATQRAVVLQTGAESEFVTSEDADLVPSAVLGLPDPSACVSFGQTIGAGSGHSVAVTGDGGVWTWGYGSRVLGRDTGAELDDPTPAPLPTIHGVREVAAGAADILAVRADGSVWSWGANRWGQMGNGSTFSGFGGPTLVGVLGVSSVAASAIGHDGNTGQSFAVRSRDGSVWAWGANNDGELGIGTTTQQSSPVQVGGLGGVTSVASGPYQTFAADGRGTLWGWGMTGTPDEYTQSLAPEVMIASDGVSAAAVGGYGTQVAQDSFAVRMRDGSVQTWGNDFYGELGQGTRSADFAPAPAPVPGLAGVVSIGAGAWSVAALDGQGNVFTWGSNASGTLGTGDATTAVLTEPTLIPRTGAVSLSVGEYHVLALRPDGTIAAWGDDTFGAVGNGTTDPGIVTVPVDALVSGVAQPGGCTGGSATLARSATASAAGGTAHSARPAPARGLPGTLLASGWRTRSQTLAARTHTLRPGRQFHMTIRTGPGQTEDVLVSR